MFLDMSYLTRIFIEAYFMNKINEKEDWLELVQNIIYRQLTTLINLKLKY